MHPKSVGPVDGVRRPVSQPPRRKQPEPQLGHDRVPDVRTVSQTPAEELVPVQPAVDESAEPRNLEGEVDASRR